MNNSLIVNKSSSKYRLTPITPTCLTASVPIGRGLWSSSQSEAGARGPERLLGVACRATASEEIPDLSREGRACCFHQLRRESKASRGARSVFGIGARSPTTSDPSLKVSEDVLLLLCPLLQLFSDFMVKSKARHRIFVTKRTDHLKSVI